ncbi:CopC domain-containing protein [Paenibacillus sp. UNC496MF]|uniref:copper resistance CopC family protein n=1 Tax=Paenibacillus sp. UNC496MF TaxID=1502753 RepID=UPI0008EDD354|nr:copper resistance CopC family protein [Paenibacillus sp. UNC496MF]SFI39620.1 CopC domain-containing protein [Paenibacillus sp. UNC496MF]
MMNLRAGILLLLIALFALPTAASAHTKLKSASPADGDTVAKALTEIKLTFATAIQPLTVLKVTDGEGNAVAVQSASGEDEITGTFGQPLANGTYQVAWRIIGEDGHNISGSYAFTVAVPDEQAPAGGGNAAAPDQPANRSDVSGSAEPDSNGEAAADPAVQEANAPRPNATGDGGSAEAVDTAAGDAPAADADSPIATDAEADDSAEKSNLGAGWIVAIGLGCLAIVGAMVRVFRS